jgi:glutamate racemase
VASSVGIFDSGVGGLTVASALYALRPDLEISYVADTACFPYGDQPPEAVADRASAITSRLVADGAAAVVVACNTASSAALERLREEQSIPIVGMEPPLKPAAALSRTRRVAVLATPGTVAGARLARLAADHASDVEVFALAMHGLADLIEEGAIDGPAVERMLREALEAPLNQGVDVIALGCTHYGFLRPLLVELLPEGVTVLDAALPVARRVIDVIDAPAPVATTERAPEVVCYPSGDASAFERVLSQLRGAQADLPPIRVERLAA